MAWLLVLFMSVAAAFAEEPPQDWLGEWPQTDFRQSGVAFDRIKSGGPPKDGIPSIDEPLFRRVEMLKPTPADTDPVISVEIGGDARAYPLSVMMWHEIVNDTVGGVPVAVTYCPLCNSGIVFDRRVGGTVTSFGTTGKLRMSNLIMYDRRSESWWQQYDGRAIVGRHMGAALTPIPSRFESFGDFADRNPDGLVLVPDDRNARAYGRNPYVGYDSSSRPFLYDGSYDGPGEPMMRVVAVKGLKEAWSLETIRKHGPVRIGDIEIGWHSGQTSALDDARIAQGRDVGTVTVDRIASDGSRTPVAYEVPFAFAFQAFNPGAKIHHK